MCSRSAPLVPPSRMTTNTAREPCRSPTPTRMDQVVESRPDLTAYLIATPEKGAQMSASETGQTAAQLEYQCSPSPVPD